ncbi:MAG: methyltransferase domain-containing protein [Gemmatimonadota bacterium]|nr:MAG: methyltransferase domain-containing protein [Gemmatimonadota bacterium]
MVDQPAPDPILLAESLGDLVWLNRYLGGTATITHQIGRLIDGERLGRLRVLDVGAGGGDILVSLGRWLGRRGVDLEGVGLDSGRETVLIADSWIRETRFAGSIGVVCGDARSLPFPDRHFDVTVSSTFLHHLGREDAERALREMARVSDLGVVVSDLRRGHLGYLAAWSLANTVWRRHPYTRHDAQASMRAAFTMGEARRLAEAAGLQAEVEAQLWFRWAMRWRRPR